MRISLEWRFLCFTGQLTSSFLFKQSITNMYCHQFEAEAENKGMVRLFAQFKKKRRYLNYGGINNGKL